MKNRKYYGISKTLSLLLALAMVFAMLPGVTAEEESTGPALKSTNATNWIDRLADIPQYASDFYAWLEENSDGDGTDDALIDPTGATTATVNGETAYVYIAASYEDSTEFTLEDGQAPDAVASEWAQDLLNTRFAAVSAWLGAVYQAFERDHPEVFWLSGSSRIGSSCSDTAISGEGTSYTASFSMEICFVLKSDSFDIRTDAYTYTETINTAIETRDAAVAAILSSVHEDSSLQEKVTYLNEWLTKNNGYNSDAASAGQYAHSCLSALAGNMGTDGPVCEGYAKAFKVLCDELGIPCVLVDGTARSSADSEGEAHMWNYVEMEDGWYAVDVTWNDPVVSGAEPAKESGSERTDYLLVGSTASINGLTFAESHVVKNQVSESGLAFTNGPTLATLKYGGVIDLTNSSPIKFGVDTSGKYYQIDSGSKVYYSGRITITGSRSSGYIQLTGKSSNNRTHYITLDNVTLKGYNGYSPLHLISNASVDLNLVGTNKLTAPNAYNDNGYPGVLVSEGTALTIGGTGSLSATGSYDGAGIGGDGWANSGDNNDCGTITINSGSITATGSVRGAGIGQGWKGNGGTITINGGTVTAIGGTGNSAKSIGGDNGTITINGGTVTARAGLGGTVKINGGTIYCNSAITGATNSNGDTLTLKKISGITEGTEIAKITYSNTEYGTEDVYTTSDGKLYLYLPADALTMITTADGTTYIVGSSGTAYIYKADPVVNITGSNLVLSNDGDITLYMLDGENYYGYTGTMTVIGNSSNGGNSATDTVTVTSGSHDILLQSDSNVSYVSSFAVNSGATANVTVDSAYNFNEFLNNGTMTLGGEGSMLSSSKPAGAVVTNYGSMTISGPLQIGDGDNGYAAETLEGANLTIEGVPKLLSGSSLIYCSGSSLDLSKAECDGWTVYFFESSTALTVGENIILPYTETPTDTQWGLVDADGNEVTTVEENNSVTVTVRNPKTTVTIAIDESALTDWDYNGQDWRETVESVITVNGNEPLPEHKLAVTYQYKRSYGDEPTTVTQIKNAGYYTVTALIPDNNADYTADPVTADFRIYQLDLTVVPDDITISRGEELKLTYKVYPGTFYNRDELPEVFEGDLLSAEDVQLITDGTSTGREGTYAIKAYVDNPNFNVANFLTGTLTVNCEKDHTRDDTYDSNGFCTVCCGYEPAEAVYETDENGELDLDYEGNPTVACYKISNAGQLYWFADYINNVKNEANAVITADITIPETAPNWIPIGNDIFNGFYGSMDGGGHTISGLRSSGGYFAGLIGYASAFDYKNIHITNSSFHGTKYSGALAAYTDNATIINCYVDNTVTVTGDSNTIGGLVGYLSGSITNSYSMTTSLVGGSYYATITNSFYLSESDDGNGGKTAAQFASGEVAYLLQAGVTGEYVYDEEVGDYVQLEAPQVWGQTIGTDSYPTLGGAKVYLVTCKGSEFYSNTNQSFDTHEYVDHRCKHCGAIEKFRIAGARMNLGNTLDMQFAFPQDYMSDWTGAYAVIVKTDISGNTVTKTILCGDWTDADNVDSEGNMYHVVSFDGIAAKEMTDEVTVTVYNANGEAISQTYADSIRDYAMRLLNEKTEQDEVATLLVDMLNYGAAAQTYFAYETEDLANASLGDKAEWATQSVTFADGLDDGDNYHGSRLELASNINLQISFSGMDPENMYAIYSFEDHRGNAHEVEIPGSSFVYDEEAGVYAVPIEEIVLSDARQLVTVTVYNSADDSVYATASDSVESYVARTIAQETGEQWTAELKALCVMLMKFATSAYNYFH